MNVLVVFENYFEIKPFIQNLNPKKINNKLFLYSEDDINYYLFVNKTEGYLNLLDSLYSINSKYEFDLLINPGIAGSLNENIKKGTVFTVKSVVNVNLETEKVLNPPIETNIFFRESKILITVPYLQKGFKEERFYFGDLLDMEGYFVSHFAKKNSIPFILIKSISDYNKNIKKDDCVHASRKLFEYFKKNINVFKMFADNKYLFEIYEHLDLSIENISKAKGLNNYLIEKEFSFTERNFIYNDIKIKYGNNINSYLGNESIVKKNKEDIKEKGFLFIEADIPTKKKYTEYFKGFKPVIIENYLNYFQYKIRRNQNNIFIANKMGRVIKNKPERYGLNNYINVSVTNGYNCPFNCSYCYLKGWFRSDDIVLFDNKDYIWKRMKKFIEKNSHKKIMFYFGDFCDALVFDDLIENIEYFSKKISKYKNVSMEYRTKSDNYKHLLNINPINNLIIGYSLSSKTIIKQYETKTAGLKQRLNALNNLQKNGFQVSIHLDPIIYYDEMITDYTKLIDRVAKNINPENVFSISIGVLRMPKKVFKTIKNEYPSEVLANLKKEKSMYKYPSKIRNEIYSNLRKRLTQHFKKDKIYICME